MKLKKILAVALAATTALTMVPSNVAFAKTTLPISETSSVTSLDKGDIFTATVYTRPVANPTSEDKVVVTFEVDHAVENGGFYAVNNASLNETQKQAIAALDNSTYDDDVRDVFDGSTTTPGTVKITGITVGSNVSNAEVAIPLAVYGRNAGDPTGNTTSPAYTVIADVEKDFATAYHSVNVYKVTSIALDGSTTNGDKIKTFALNTSGVTDVETIKLENFENLTSIDLGQSGTQQQLSKLKNFSVKGSKLTVAEVGRIVNSGSATNLETLDLSDLKDQDKDTAKEGAVLSFRHKSGTAGELFNTATCSLTKINVAGSAIQSLSLHSSKGLTVDISDCNRLTYLDVEGNVSTPTYQGTHIGNAYNKPALYAEGVSFITDGANATHDLDMSSFSGMTHVRVINAALSGFTAPSFESDKNKKLTADLDVSGNALTKISLSNASDALKVDFSNNMLLDADISGLSAATYINASENFLTSIDARSNLENLNLNCDKNYIHKDKLEKETNQTSISIGSQTDLTNQTFFAYTGDLGQGLNASSKATAKIGGNGGLFVGVMALGAPDGFAERLAQNLEITDGNTAETSAVAVGEKQILKQEERDYNPTGMGSKSIVLATATITANAEKRPADKITATVGNSKKIVNINTDNIVTLTYDISSAIEKENIKKDNQDQIDLAPFYYPQTAYTLGANGTVNANIQSEKPGDKGTGLAETLKAYKMKGVTFSKWNTAVDGSGQQISANGRIKDMAENTTIYAQYTENVYNINFLKDQGATDNTFVSSKVSVSGSTTTQSKVPYGDEVALNSNGSSAKDGNYYGWASGNNGTFYSDGQSVKGLPSGDEEPYKKSGKAELRAIYGESNHYTTTEKTSVDLVVGDPEKGAFKKGDLKPSVSGAPEDNKYRPNVDLGFGDVKDYQYLTSDAGIVTFDGEYLVAKGSGTANVYVRDKKYGNMATVSVTVLGKAEAAAAAEAAKKAAAVNKALEAGETVDVSDYCTYAKKIKKNADGENTVTIVKGKNKKTVKIGTITVGDKTYTVTRVGKNAYKKMSKLQTVVLSNKVKYVGAGSFSYCYKLKKATLGKAVLKIGAKAFYKDKKLAVVKNKSKKLTKKARVGKNAFKGNKANGKHYLVKNAKTFKKTKKAIKAQSGVPKTVKYIKKF